MIPFINLKKSSQYGGSEEYLVNVNHIVRVAQYATGSQIFTLGGDFFCDEDLAKIKLLISHVFDQTTRVISGN